MSISSATLPGGACLIEGRLSGCRLVASPEPEPQHGQRSTELTMFSLDAATAPSSLLLE